MKRILIIYSICFTSFIYGQISSELADIVPSSPSVDGFKKQLNFPVDKFSGLPNINYDIYSFNIDVKKGSFYTIC